MLNLLKLVGLVVFWQRCADPAGGILLVSLPPSLPIHQAGTSYTLGASLLIAQSQTVFYDKGG